MAGAKQSAGHHIQERSLLGDDTEENLITCATGATDERTWDSLVGAPSPEREHHAKLIKERGRKT